MATLEHEISPPLPPAVRSRIDALRAGIRRYVWLEGHGRDCRLGWALVLGKHGHRLDLRAAASGPRGPARGGRNRPRRGAFPLHSSPGLCSPQRQQHGHGPGTPFPRIQRQPADDGPADRAIGRAGRIQSGDAGQHGHTAPSSGWPPCALPTSSTPCRGCGSWSSRRGWRAPVGLLAWLAAGRA